MVGLYFVDRSGDPGVAYDYLLLADHDGSLGGSAASALSWLSSVADFSVVDGRPWSTSGFVATAANVTADPLFEGVGPG
jgi:hypothetical protein